MLKVFLFFVINLMVVCQAVSFAAPCYGTHMPEKKHWVWGVQADMLLDRNLDNSEGGVSGNRYFITGSYALFDWLSLDGKIGVGNVRWENSDPGNLAFDTGFAGAYGFRVKLYDDKDSGLKAVAGFQHISVHPHAASVASDNYKAIVDEWQGSLLVSRRIGRFEPYSGPRYGSLDFIKWVNDHDRQRIKSEKKVGIVAGVDYIITRNIRLNVETAFFDGEKVSLAVSRDF
ncbi:MAG: hypothetical protein WC312_00245 [Candidatus Omnitrophota bacterium]|jgi:hypothetical protein